MQFRSLLTGFLRLIFVHFSWEEEVSISTDQYISVWQAVALAVCCVWRVGCSVKHVLHTHDHHFLYRSMTTNQSLTEITHTRTHSQWHTQTRHTRLKKHFGNITSFCSFCFWLIYRALPEEIQQSEDSDRGGGGVFSIDRTESLLTYHTAWIERELFMFFCTFFCFCFYSVKVKLARWMGTNYMSKMWRERGGSA